MAEDVRAEIVASVLEVVVHEGDQMIGEGDTLVLLELAEEDEDGDSGAG